MHIRMQSCSHASALVSATLRRALGAGQKGGLRSIWGVTRGLLGGLPVG
jgi:hypothetical protein